jgi:hypothetical protein
LEEAAGVEGLNPFAIGSVGFAAGDALELTGVDEEDFDAVGIEEFEERNPVDAGAFEGSGDDIGLLEPVKELEEIGGGGAKDADFGRTIGSGSTDEMVFAADVDAGDVGTEHRDAKGAGAPGRFRVRGGFVFHGVNQGHKARMA